MQILYKLYSINNLNYKFDNTVIQTQEFSERFELNLDIKGISINNRASSATLKLAVLVESFVNDDSDIFRTMSFDMNYIYNLIDYSKLSDEDVMKFVVENGLSNAMTAAKDVIKQISDIDYQGRIQVDIPEFPLNLSFLEK